ncbi:MAG: S-layer homology domain-containing protein [Anaerovorax sp.]|nr:S-layer homology domain-containing protein [Anaerovorax sp.]
MSEVPCSYDPTAKLATFKVNHFSLYVVGTAKTGSWVNPYSDIKASNWFYDAVRYVSANNLMQGTKDTAFSPNAKTTRGMIVTILWRMENSPKATKGTTFADVKNGKYYYDAVVWASEKGIVGGYSAEHFASPAFYGKRCKVNINLSEV